MPNCKVCGRKVERASVMHDSCLGKRLEHIAEEICDNYCKFAETYRYAKDEFDLHEFHCSRCPFRELEQLAKLGGGR